MATSPEPVISVAPAHSPAEIAQIHDLFMEYARSLNFDLCFQDFNKELAELPGDYAPPRGRLLLARVSGAVAGCAALHPLDGATCEMKRLYVRPAFRGKRVGLALAQNIIAEAREIGYRRMRLDTVAPVMQEAVAMYRQFGFREIAPYRTNPIAGALYMELDL
jgi:putative acetyltransferase